MARGRDLNYFEWRQEQLRKAPATGGVTTPISPGFAAAGYNHPGYPGRGIGMPSPTSRYPEPSPESKYNLNVRDQPQPWIDDVDMASNWYSPFQPIWPFGPPYVNQPREWDFPVGYNLQYIQPRYELTGMLRGMARTWGVLSTIVATRMDQLLRIPWTIQDRTKPRAKTASVKEMQAFFKRPDGKLRYSQWTRKLLYDLLEIDAPTIYFARDRKGRPLSAEVLDGRTIFPLIDDAGRRPDTIVEVDEDGLTYLKRQPAFQQIIKGLPMVDLDESELMYTPMRPRPDMPLFGYPPTEQILVETSEAVRKTFYQLDFWREGTIPDLIVTVPKDWTPRQITMFQGHFDALLSGNIRLKSKVRFLPGDMKPFDIKNSSGESLWSQRDETLIRLACYAYSVSPAPFVKMLNRSVAQSAQQTAEEEGLYPLMSFWKDDIIDPIIQERFGYDDTEFTFLPKPEPDLEKASKIHEVKFKTGEMSINELRAEQGLEPVQDGDVHLIVAGNAVIPLSDAAAGKALPMMGGDGQGGDGKGDNKPKSQPNKRPTGEPLRGPARRTSSGSASPVTKATRYEVEAAARSSDKAIEDTSYLQRKVGNYKKGHIWIQGLNITIENEKGSLRSEKDIKGKVHHVVMPTAYGYIRGTMGADNMQMDVYLGKRPESNTVWIIDQDKVSKSGKNNGFDEHKVMLGYDNQKKALKDYLKSHFDGLGHERLWRMTEMSVSDLKDWLETGNMKQPVADQDFGKTVLKRKQLRRQLGKLAKADTISSSTNLLWYDQSTRRRKTRKRKSRQGPRWMQLNATSIN